jgi:hypothetical protein
MKLVDVQSIKILWAADELFDAGQTAVAKAAERYSRATGESWLESSRDGVLLSPRRFGQYTLSALLATLPDNSQ